VLTTPSHTDHGTRHLVVLGDLSSGARQFAENVAMRIRLIDGKELTRLMVKYNIGVQVRETFELKQIDEETFAEQRKTTVVELVHRSI
jgi:restriction endonuclease Mrr